jgi:hypothetical protein
MNVQNNITPPTSRLHYLPENEILKYEVAYFMFSGIGCVFKIV